MKKFFGIFPILFLSLIICIQPVFSQETNSIQLIRNATVKIKYANKTILVDPMFSDTGEMNLWKNSRKNPTKQLLIPVNDILKDVDFVLITHTHEDHFDHRAQEALDKAVIIYHPPYDKEYFRNTKFTNSQIIKKEVKIGDIKIHRVKAQHGKSDKLSEIASGYILTAKNQPTIYLTSDTILNKDVENTIKKYKPDYIITNSGGAIIPSAPVSDGPVILDELQTIELAEKSPKNSVIIAVHMEALDYCYSTRVNLRNLANKNNISKEKLIIPVDTEIIQLKSK